MRIPFSARIIASVVIIEVVMLGILVWNNIRIINQSYTDLLESSSHEQSIFLASAIAPGLVAYDYALIEDALSLIKESDNIMHAEVFDINGKRVGYFGEYYENVDFPSSKNYQVIRDEDMLHVHRIVSVAGQEVGSLHIGFSLHSLKEVLAEIRWHNIIISFITLSALILATVIISFMLTRKLHKINNGVVKIQAGILNYKINVKEMMSWVILLMLLIK